MFQNFILGGDIFGVKKFLNSRATLGEKVEMTAGVLPNPYNETAKQLKEKELALANKEIEIEKQEQDLVSILTEQKRNTNKIIICISFAMTVLAALILLNFYLDYKKKDRRDKIKTIK